MPTHISKLTIAAGLGSVVFAGVLGAALPARKKFYSDDPIWKGPKPVPVKAPQTRKLSEYYDFFENTFFPAGERAAHSGVFLPSQGINTIDEVPDSAWYTNRHATRRMSLDELKVGPGDSNPPSPGKWTVVAAKNEGVTPGFRIRDAAGRQYLLKFDPPSNPELASAADVITSKFMYALGYNVPENYIVYFDRKQLAIGKDAMVKDAEGRKHPIFEADIAEMLEKTPKAADGRYRALASRIIAGQPLGPFRYNSTRRDDPNDLVDHENRRDLRALRTFCAWLGHDDSKALNTLDVLTEEDGVPFLKHYLIDFGASLGSASFMANSPRDGNVYLFGWKSSAAQFFTLGFYVPAWQRANYPKLPAVGRFEYEVFDPARWVGDYPNAAFRNENPADRLWAARKIAAFTEPEIRAMVEAGRYADPAAEEWVVRCLVERRKKILDAFLNGTANLDRFEVAGGRLNWSQVRPEAMAALLKVEWSIFDNPSGKRTPLPGETSAELPKVEGPVEYLVAELTGRRGPRVSVYVKMKEQPLVVGVERLFPAGEGN